MEHEEFQKLKYSKIFVDKLILGMDPISGKAAGDNEIICNPRVKKCLAYISENLDRQIQRELKKEETEIERSKPPFSATAQQLQRYLIPSYPLTITKIVEKINEAVGDPSRQKLRYKNVADFLEEKGYLMKSPVEGSRAMVITPKSGEIGMSTEKRVMDDGEEYTVIIYNEEAQKYILDNISEIIKKLQ